MHTRLTCHCFIVLRKLCNVLEKIAHYIGKHFERRLVYKLNRIMKNFFLLSMIAMLTIGMVAQPIPTYAKSENSGHGNSRDRDDDDDRWERESEDEDEDLEIEADVFTDTTIVKVELRNGKKTVFETDADTRDEVIDVVVDKFDLTEDEVDAALDFEIEDRASRTSERAKISFKNNRPEKVEVCETTSSSTLQVEADVFTDITIVKVENGNTRTVFETEATTSEDIIDAVVEKFDLDADDVEDALDLEVEDRESRSSDYDFPASSNDDDCDDTSSTSTRDAELRAKISQLQDLINKLIKLLTLRLGNVN